MLITELTQQKPLNQPWHSFCLVTQHAAAGQKFRLWSGCCFVSVEVNVLQKLAYYPLQTHRSLVTSGQILMERTQWGLNPHPFYFE